MQRKLSQRWRLALFGVFAVVLTMVAAAVAFNAFETSQLRKEVETAINETVGWAESDARPSSRAANYIILNDDYWLIDEGSHWYSDFDYELVSWINAHADELNAMRRVEIGDTVCYLELFEVAWDEFRSTVLAVYVDVTAEEELVRTVNLVFAAITLLGMAIAAWAGWRAGKRIEEANAASKRFFENASHELKTPLAAIQGYSEGALAGVVEPDRAWHAVLHESRRMSKLVGQILELSRLDAGAVTLKREAVNVSDFVQDCLMPFEGMVRACDLQIVLEVEPGEIQADPDLFGHALENVLSNAVRHARSMVRIGYNGEQLWVENDGDLPSAEEIGRIFDRFASSSAGGTGIGLTLAREITELHGWQLNAELVEGPMLRMTFGSFA